jgi:hypothetical protein
VPPKTRRKETVDRSRRRIVAGVVTADKMAKTITVRVERLVQHPVFGKTLRKSYVCYAHDEAGGAPRGPGGADGVAAPLEAEALAARPGRGKTGGGHPGGRRP